KPTASEAGSGQAGPVSSCAAAVFGTIWGTVRKVRLRARDHRWSESARNAPRRLAAELRGHGRGRKQTIRGTGDNPQRSQPRTVFSGAGRPVQDRDQHHRLQRYAGPQLRVSYHRDKGSSRYQAALKKRQPTARNSYYAPLSNAAERFGFVACLGGGICGIG